MSTENECIQLLKSIWEKIACVLGSDFTKDIILIIVGALVSHMGSIFSSRGKLKVFYANYIEKIFKRSACFMKSPSYVSRTDFFLPVQLDFVNTSGRKHVFRAVSAVVYFQGKKVAVLNPITGGQSIPSGAQKEASEYVHYGVPKSSYSFTIPEHECFSTNLLYLFQVEEREKVKNTFDEVKLEWYDTKNIHRRATILKIQNCWKEGNVDLSFDWTELRAK